MLIVTLAFAATSLTGAAMEQRGFARQHQANTIRTRRVISLFRLGIYAMQTDEIDLGLRHVITMRLILQVYVHRPFPMALPFTRLRGGRWR